MRFPATGGVGTPRSESARRWPVGLLVTVLLAAGTLSAAAEIVRLEAPGRALDPERLCLIGPEAEFSWSDGQPPVLQPARGLFSYFREGEVPLWPVVRLPESVVRGEVIRPLLALPEALEGLELQVTGGEGEETSIRVPGFALDRGGRAWAVVLGVESTVQAGQRTLILTGWSGDRKFEYHAGLQVLHREFESESIAFNQALSELMTAPDPRKDQEYFRLRDVLAAHDLQSLYHQGQLIVPVAATRRTSGFADRRLYSYADGGSSRSLHNGVDLAAPIGTSVVAAGAGRVVLAADRVLTGLTVVLEHLPGVYSLYYHLDSLVVEEGRLVDQGETIGTVGMTGLATGPHLHWELRVAGTAVDPDSLVREPLIDETALWHIMEDLHMGLRRVEFMDLEERR